MKALLLDYSLSLSNTIPFLIIVDFIYTCNSIPGLTVLLTSLLLHLISVIYSYDHTLDLVTKIEPPT